MRPSRALELLELAAQSAALLIALGPMDAAAGTSLGCRPPEEEIDAKCPPLPRQPICEGRRCFYVSPCHGDDERGDGSFEKPWRSLRWLTYYFDDLVPPRAERLRAGDVVYLLGGPLSRAWSPFGQSARASDRYLFMARSLHGTATEPITLKAFPGQEPVLDPRRASVAIRLLESSHLRLEGLTVRNACGRGVLVERSQDIGLRSLSVADTDGLDDDGVAGVYVQSSREVRIEGGEFFDNFDRDAENTEGDPTEDSGNVVFFSGADATVQDVHIFNTLGEELAGYCLKYQEAASSPDATFRVLGSRFDNCTFFAISTGTQNTLVRDNLIVGGAALASRDNGSITHQHNQRFEHNTIYVEGPGIEIDPTAKYRTSAFPNDPSGLVFRNNIVVDLRLAYASTQGIVEIGTFMTDVMLKHVSQQLDFAGNCYSNVRTAVRFALGASPLEGKAGARYDVFDWKALGYDAGSVLASPRFQDAESGDFRLAPGSACQDKGTRIFRQPR